jgi:microcin C transport system substrate-binding protein
MINSLELTRRATLLLGAAAFTSFIARNVEAAQDSECHGMSAFGDLKYPPDFEHFDYVNPDAPKGGVFSHVGATRIFNQNLLTFNSLARRG